MERSKSRGVGGDKSAIVAEIPLACSDEREAVEFLERQRWGSSPACPRCGDTNVYQVMDRKTGERSARFLWDCRGCRRQFTVRIGTVLEDSRVPLRHWCYAFWAACASKFQGSTAPKFASAPVRKFGDVWASHAAAASGGGGDARCQSRARS